jgi:hypothetical protein
LIKHELTEQGLQGISDERREKGVFVEMYVDAIEDYRCHKHEE